MKILIATYYWPPAGGPGVQRWLGLSRFLQRGGAQVSVLTVDPERAAYPLRDPGLEEKVEPGIQVLRTDNRDAFGLYLKWTGRKEIPFSGFANESARPGFRQQLAKWIRGNVFLPDARKGWNRFAFEDARRQHAIDPFHVVITTGPPHSTHLLGMHLQRALNIKWVADFRDPWTDIYYASELRPSALARWIDARMETRVLRTADRVYASSPSLLGRLQAKGAGNRAELLTNGYDPEDFPEIPASNPRPHQRPELVYLGTMSRIYTLDGLIEALKRMGDNAPVVRLIGVCDAVLRRQIEGSGISAVFEDPIPHSEAVQRMVRADVLLLLIPEQSGNEGIVPGKLFEYVASGRPILGIGPRQCDAATLLTQAGAGIFCDYRDASALGQSIEALLEIDGASIELRRGFGRDAQAQAVLRDLKKLVG
ncbi:hypothetical protein GC167_02025 [bacterium]|nr:hypothetical protein [bacterium]